VYADVNGLRMFYEIRGAADPGKVPVVGCSAAECPATWHPCPAPSSPSCPAPRTSASPAAPTCS
jgi:hypothetical protein